jgi:hypothetical protein
MKLLVPIAFLSLAACGSGVVYLNKDIRRVVVLPPFNASNNIEASNKLWPSVQGDVASRGYAVVPQSEVVAYYEKCHYTLPEEIEQVPGGPGGIAKLFNAEAVVYTNITNWGKKTLLVSNWVGVQLEASLVDAKTGEGLWSGKGEDGKSSGGLNLRDAALSAAGTLLTDPGQYAAGACHNTYRSLPRAGWDPKDSPKMDNVKPDKK